MSASPVHTSNRRTGHAVGIGDVIAKITGQRRTLQPVRRGSYDIEDRRAQVFRPIGDGTIAGGLRWRDKYLQLADEYDWAMKQRGERHQIGANAIRVLKALLFLPGLEFAKGHVEPALDTIMKHTRFARGTVVSALQRLKQHGFIDWVRRTIKTGNEPGFGPQVKQTSNAYFFPVERLPDRARERLRQLMGGKPLAVALKQKKAADAARREALKNMSYEEGYKSAPADDSALGEALNNYARMLDQSASSETGLNPPLRNQKQKD